LASIGHAIIGDYKYGNAEINNIFKKKYKVKDQLLHSWKIKFPVIEQSSLSEQEYTAQPPEVFNRIIKEEMDNN
jgi:23S rRNA pseudouridine955/2504/2580 synthase